MKAYALPGADQPAALIDVPEPDLPADGIRVRVHAASINGFDVFEANGYLVGMMEHVYPTVIGRDFAGVVEALGSGRDDVAVGDAVLGFITSDPPLHLGTWAEVVAGGANVIVSRLPDGLPFESAAAIPLAGATALAAVDAVEIGPGDVILVGGATGGVGSFAVQLAAQRGATVIATARAGDSDAFVRSLGAADTVDYAGGDVVDTVRSRYPDGVAALIDSVNRDAVFGRVAELVRSGGRIATTLGAADVDALAARDIRATNVRGIVTPENLSRLAEAVVAGTLRVEIQRTFPLADTAAGLAAFSAGTRGKIVLTIA